MKDFTNDTIIIGSSKIHLIQFSEFNPNDYLHLISETEQLRLATFNHIQRRREFIATRILKHDLFGYKTIEYESHGAPYIKNEGFISISHSNDCCGIAVCEDYQIGLDLEAISPKAQKLHSKFISDTESTFLDVTNEKVMTKSWSCKEALYKLAGRKEIIFKTDLRIINNKENKWKCEILNPSKKIVVNLETLERRDQIITINTCAIESYSLK